MEQYSILAKYYDALMSDVDYGAFADFYEKCFEKYGAHVNSICDMGCGTGTLSVLLSKRGYNVLGVDISSEMLALAQKKSDDAGEKALFVCQNMTCLDTGTPCDAAVCSLDGINYLTQSGDVDACFGSVANTLCDGGMFIFDVGTPYKYKNVLGNNSFVYELDGMFLSWQSFYNDKSKICDYVLTFFSKDKSVWHRLDEYQRQRAYSLAILERKLKNAGFEVLGKFGNTDFTPINPESERCFFVCRKAKDE